MSHGGGCVETNVPRSTTYGNTHLRPLQGFEILLHKLDCAGERSRFRPKNNAVAERIPVKVKVALSFAVAVIAVGSWLYYLNQEQRKTEGQWRTRRKTFTLLQ